MTDEGRDHHMSTNAAGAPSSPPSPTVAVFAVALLAGLGAAGAAYGLGDLLGLGVGAVIAAIGAVVAAVAARKAIPPDVKAIALLDAVTAEDAPSNPPSRFRAEPWASLYLRCVADAEAQRTATLAISEVKRLRSELEKKPAAAAEPEPAFEPSPSHEAHQLVGVNRSYGEAATPAVSNDRAAVFQALTEALEPIRLELSAIEHDLEPLVVSLRAESSTTSTMRNGTPAQMVDALVQTAADGIEDLAAGLMRASELAGVAERVTNRATLLALNAALEATRSGSESFASIAEETRRLAEYAREATDTISRLSNEIELKVCETIASIQTSSEDAKAAVASMGSGTSGADHAVAPETVRAMQALLLRVRALRGRAVVNDEAPADREEAPVVAAVTFVEEAVHATSAPSVAPSVPDSSISFGSVAFGEVEAPPAPSEFSEAPESPDRAESTDAAEPAESAETPPTLLPADPATLVVPKIPDWLEGIEPRRRD